MRDLSFFKYFLMILLFVATVNSSKSIVKQGWFWTLAFFIHEVRRSKKALKNHPETVQKSMKIQPKMESRTHPNENPSPRPSSESILAPFCPHLGSILAPISLPKPSKSLPRALWKKHRIFIRFLIKSAGNLGGGSRGVPGCSAPSKSNGFWWNQCSRLDGKQNSENADFEGHSS